MFGTRHSLHCSFLKRPSSLSWINSSFSLFILDRLSSNHNKELCVKGSISLNHIKHHKKIHTGNNPYHCALCAQLSLNGVGLTKHLTTSLSPTSKQSYIFFLLSGILSTFKQFKQLFSIRKTHTRTLGPIFSCI